MQVTSILLRSSYYIYIYNISIMFVNDLLMKVKMLPKHSNHFGQLRLECNCNLITTHLKCNYNKIQLLIFCILNT